MHLPHPQPTPFMPIPPYHPTHPRYDYLPASWNPDKEIEQIPSRRRRLDNGEKAIIQ